jgi:hypothetical protein
MRNNKPGKDLCQEWPMCAKWFHFFNRVKYSHWEENGDVSLRLFTSMGWGSHGRQSTQVTSSFINRFHFLFWFVM